MVSYQKLLDHRLKIPAILMCCEIFKISFV